MPVEKKLSYYINESKKLNDSDFEKQIRIAVLGSFTLNGLAETIKVKCAESNVFSHTFSGGYNQYNEEMLDPKSKLYSFSPEICFLVLDIKDILENLFYSPYSISDDERKKFIENKAIELSNLIKFFIDKSKSKLIVTNFVPPTYSPYGIFESKTNYGLQEMIYDLNHKLLQEFKNNPLVYVFDFNGFVTTLGQNNIFDYRQYYFAVTAYAYDGGADPRVIESPINAYTAIPRPPGVGSELAISSSDDIAVTHTVGLAGATVHPTVVDPYLLTGNNYSFETSLEEKTQGNGHSR